MPTVAATSALPCGVLGMMAYLSAGLQKIRSICLWMAKKSKFVTQSICGAWMSARPSTPCTGKSLRMSKSPASVLEEKTFPSSPGLSTTMVGSLPDVDWEP